MDPQTLSQTTILYALSTLAQVCAALVAFIGAIAIYQTQRNREMAQRLAARLEPFRPASSAQSGFASLRPPESPQDIERDYSVVMDELIPDHNRGTHVFLVFVIVNLGAILGAFVGFSCVSWLAGHWGLFLFLLVSTAVCVCLVTLAMAAELARYLRPWLAFLHLSWLAALLEQEWRGRREGAES